MPLLNGTRRPIVSITLAAVLIFVAGWLIYQPATGPTGPLPMSAAVLATLKPGDLVFREGTQAISAAVQRVDGGSYSHVGLLLGSPGHWQVVHAVPAERADRQDGVVIDSLAFFLDRQRAQRAAFYRVEASDPARQRALAYAKQQLGVRFRVGPDAGDGTYCTTLVWQAYRHGGIDLQTPFTHLNLPLLSGDYLLPSSLRMSPRLRQIQTTP